jgi:hypothetical protein
MLSAPSAEVSPVSQIEQLVAQLDASLPNATLGETPESGITPEQLAGLTATW